MQGPVLDDWTRVTAARIKKHSEAELAKDGEDEIVVTVQLDDIQQRIVEDGRRRDLENTHRLGRGRDLQIDNPLQVTYLTTLSFRSPHSDYNPNQMIASGFASPAKQREYIYSLKAADSDYFESVDSFVMTVDGQIVTEDGGVVPPITGGGDDAGGSDYTMYYAIGGAAGGVSLCILLVGGVYFAKRRRKRTAAGKEKTLDGDAGTAKGSGTPAGYEYNGNVSTGMHSHASPYGSNPDSGPTQATSYFGTIESREGEADDVSTLGEPYFGEAVPSGMVDRDDTVADR